MIINLNFADAIENDAAHQAYRTTMQAAANMSSKMDGDAAKVVADTFVFHANGGSPYSNSVNNFDVNNGANHDFLQFDKGMFSQDTAAAVLAAAADDNGRPLGARRRPVASRSGRRVWPRHLNGEVALAQDLPKDRSVAAD
jgi:hypothetical protein